MLVAVVLQSASLRQKSLIGDSIGMVALVPGCTLCAATNQQFVPDMMWSTACLHENALFAVHLHLNGCWQAGHPAGPNDVNRSRAI